MKLKNLIKISLSRACTTALAYPRLFTAAAAALSVIATGSLLQATHGYQVFAQTGAPSSENRSTSQAPEGSRPIGSGTTSSTAAAGAAGAAAKSQAAGAATASTAPATSATPAAHAAAPRAAAPAAAPAPASSWKYPLHSGIKTTYFWAGEEASADNDYIQNISSAWQTDWKSYFGGTDDPNCRSGYNPCGFTPRENPFYFALPFGDYTEAGQISNMSVIPWYTGPVPSGQSILKNRWIQVNALGKTVYAQWEDVGPFGWTDSNYVFGSAAPASTRAGLDVSPAVRDYLGMGGSTTSSWRFVDYSEVPAGPWKNIVTTSVPDWR